MWSLGMEGGASRRNWAIPVGNLAGEGWRRKRGLPWTGLWPHKGGGTPVAGRPAAPSEPGRGAPRSGGAPVWEAARVARGGWGGRVELRGSTGLWRNELEEGVSRRGAQAVHRRVLPSAVPTGARPVRLWPLRGFMGRRGDGTRLQCHGTVTTSPCVHTRPAMDRWSPRSGTTR
jgi:hypothetical protein